MKTQAIAQKETLAVGDNRNDAYTNVTPSPTYTSMRKQVQKIKDPVSFSSLKVFYRIS